ncbi:MAG: V-type ATP synthase subunit D [Symbiobacteriaceae bacterium]|nr:V-type ATP synthase subunit D [Symbiobacteriaceae bacterium]
MIVTATRMELSRYRKRLKTSEEAHKLLKDKQDDLMRRFITMIREIDELRNLINGTIRRITTETGLTVAASPPQIMTGNALVPEPLVTAEISTSNHMGVTVVEIAFDLQEAKPGGALMSTPLLARSGFEMRNLLPSLLRLTVLEKNSYLLAGEIEVLRRRVNALEHLVIPELKKDIRAIQLKLSDSERETIARLIKMKSFTERPQVTDGSPVALTERFLPDPPRES